jgi:hypothetical protein
LDWQIGLAFGALLVGAAGFLSRSFDKSLSIREHEEYRNSMLRNLEDIRTSYRRECDRLEDRIKVLEQTRPTTGEIEARLERGGSEPHGTSR